MVIMDLVMPVMDGREAAGRGFASDKRSRNATPSNRTAGLLHRVTQWMSIVCVARGNLVEQHVDKLTAAAACQSEGNAQFLQVGGERRQALLVAL